MQALQVACLQVNTDLHALAQVLSWFDQFNCSPVPSKIWLQCQLALAEGFTNAVRHAHQNQRLETSIDVEVTLFSDCIEIRIWDQGPAFDLNQKLIEMAEQNYADSEGGRGLLLMEKLVDQLNYIRVSNNRNCLLMVKKYD